MIATHNSQIRTTLGFSPHVHSSRSLHRQCPISPDCVFDASLVPGTCPGLLLDLNGLIKKFLEES